MEGATLTLRDCHINAASISRLRFLVRRAPGVELRECRIQVAELALCVEVGSGPECAVVIANSTAAKRHDRVPRPFPFGGRKAMRRRPSV